MKQQLLYISVSLCLLLSHAITAPVNVEQNKKLKLRIAVVPLDWRNYEWIDNWQIPIEFRNAIYEKLVKRLHDTGRFVVLERQAMETLIQEKVITEEATGISQKGKIIPAQALVHGKVTNFSLKQSGGSGGVDIGGVRVGGSVSNATMAINLRVFSVDTSELLFVEEAKGSAQSTSFRVGASIGNTFSDFSAFEKSPLGEATDKAINEAVQKILQKMEKTPWSARVADFDEENKEVIINAGSEAGVSAGDTFEIHRITRVIRDPETGQVIGQRTSKVGKIKITEVEQKFSIGIIVEGEGFLSGDIVREIK